MASQYKKHGFPETRGPNRQRRNFLNFLDRVRIEDTARVLDFMAPMASIPALDWAVLKRRFPELVSRDPQIQKHAWDVFMAHPASEPYRTKEKRRTSGSNN